MKEKVKTKLTRETMKKFLNYTLLQRSFFYIFALKSSLSHRHYVFVYLDKYCGDRKKVHAQLSTEISVLSPPHPLPVS